MNTESQKFVLTEDQIYNIISRSMAKALGDDFITPKEMLQRVINEMPAASQSEQGYSEAEVKELLRQQREKCARAYLDNFKNHGILNAPEPQLKSSLKPQPNE
jgi:hypothetical protein